MNEVTPNQKKLALAFACFLVLVFAASEFTSMVGRRRTEARNSRLKRLASSYEMELNHLKTEILDALKQGDLKRAKRREQELKELDEKMKAKLKELNIP